MEQLSRNLFSHSSGCQKSEIKVSTGLVLSEVCLLSCKTARWLTSPSVLTCPSIVTWSSHCVCVRANFLFAYGHQSYWTRVHPHDPILI